jgi:predicted aspartyl protease
LLVVTVAVGRGETRGAEASKQPMQAYLEKLGYLAIPLELKGNKHVLNGRLNGRNIRIMVDTGWSITTVSTREAKRLKTLAHLDKVLNDPVLGKLAGDEYKLVEQLELGPVKLQVQPARVGGLNMANQANPDLVIGMDLLTRFHCLLDCLELRLYFRTEAPTEALTKALRGTLDKSGFSRVAARTPNELVLTCDGNVNGKAVKWVIDTGAFWSMLDSATVRRLKLNDEFTGWRAVGAGSIGSTTLRVTKAKEIELGGVKFRWVDLGVADLSNWGLGRGEKDILKVDAILGIEQLVKHNAPIDCAAGDLWVHPGDDPPRR